MAEIETEEQKKCAEGKAGEERIEKAASSFAEMQKRIEPFVRPRRFPRVSSAGLWQRENGDA